MISIPFTKIIKGDTIPKTKHKNKKQNTRFFLRLKSSGKKLNRLASTLAANIMDIDSIKNKVAKSAFPSSFSQERRLEILDRILQEFLADFIRKARGEAELICSGRGSEEECREWGEECELLTHKYNLFVDQNFPEIKHIMHWIDDYICREIQKELPPIDYDTDDSDP